MIPQKGSFDGVLQVDESVTYSIHVIRRRRAFLHTPDSTIEAGYFLRQDIFASHLRSELGEWRIKTENREPGTTPLKVVGIPERLFPGRTGGYISEISQLNSECEPTWSAKRQYPNRRRYRIAKQQQSFTRINDAIRVPEIRLINSEGAQVGIVETSQAMAMAEEADLDLVEVAPEAKPPVCRIMDYGKYRFDKEKKAKEARKKGQAVQMKTVRIKTANISEHDMEYRLGHIREFIGKGNLVKISMRFLGRQVAYRDRGRQVMQEVADKLLDVAVVHQHPQMEGREMSMILRPL